ncbi:hypothetical protein LSAT2_022066 [Lamellibrachia satsuma]|nr:hypothetical protein LSAT2_022066 [Lamellibrachia satsuma]
MGSIEPHAEAQKMARFALELLDDVNKIRTDALGAAQISVRVAIHTAPTVVGLVNTDEIPIYVFPGNTLPILTKLINCSEDGRIHMSYPTFQIIHDLDGFVTRQRKTKINNEVEWTPTAWLLGLDGASLSDDQDRDSLVGDACEFIR